MRRLSLFLLALTLASCAHGRNCPAVDEERLARALAAEILVRAERNDDSPDDGASDDLGEIAPEDETRYRIDVAGHPTRGPANAWVTIVEFSDFQCPFCARVEPTLDALVERYGDRLRIVYFHRPLPFHDHADEAAEAANEAYVQGGDAAFLRMRRSLFASQGGLDHEAILRAATDAGVDATRVARALELRSHRLTIAADQLAAARVGASGTPTFFLNGRRFVGAQPLEAFATAIDRELEIARALVANGTADDTVYATLMRDAVDQVERPDPVADDFDAPRSLDPDLVYRVPVGSSPVRGRSDALVTIVEFADFQCPFCSRASATLDALVDRFGADLRIVYKHRPLAFHAYARYAAATAIEARAQLGDDAFFAMAHRFAIDEAGMSDESIDSVARELGVDMARLAASRADGRHDAAIAADDALATRLGVEGTPTFFVNGRAIIGAQPLEAFTESVTEALTNARALVASGTPRAQVYLRVLESAVADPGDTGQQIRLALGADPVAEGSESAGTVVQVSTDLTSPEAARLETHLAKLRTEFVGRIRIVYLDRASPTNPVARIAAEAGREVFAARGISGYLAFRRAVVARGPELRESDVERLAVAAGRANRSALRRALATRRHAAAIDADTTRISQATSYAGTSIFVVVGTTPLADLRSYDTYQVAVATSLGR